MKITYRVPGLRVDVNRLSTFLTDEVLHIRPSGSHWGGWSVLSSDGSTTDGWQAAYKAYEQGETSIAPSIRGLKFNVPTPLCKGYMKEVITMLHDHELLPTRARIMRLKAGSSSDLHVDAVDRDFYRLHIPIRTNKGCVFECEGQSVHMPADGHAYVVRINRLHQIHNRGTEDRFHLGVDILPNHRIEKALL